MIPFSISVTHEIQEKKIDTLDGGRMMRPIIYCVKNEEGERVISYDMSETTRERLRKGDFTWNQCVSGFLTEEDEPNKDKFYTNIEQLYKTTSKDKIESNIAIIDYIDSSELETSYLCDLPMNFDSKKSFTHIDIHPTLLLGVMGNQVVLPEHNPLPRDLFACGQSKQAVSLYHSNFRYRIDKMGIILNYGEAPLLSKQVP